MLLAFKIKPSSNLIWLPDALLLAGFFPLLISACNACFWLLFGVMNIFTGLVLLVALSLPESELAQKNLLEMNRHLQSYHPYYVWILVGLLSSFIGCSKLAVGLFLWLRRRICKKS